MPRIPLLSGSVQSENSLVLKVNGAPSDDNIDNLKLGDNTTTL